MSFDLSFQFHSSLFNFHIQSPFTPIPVIVVSCCLGASNSRLQLRHSDGHMTIVYMMISAQQVQSEIFNIQWHSSDMIIKCYTSSGSNVCLPRPCNIHYTYVTLDQMHEDLILQLDRYL